MIDDVFKSIGQSILSGTLTSSIGGGSAYLDGVLSSACCDLDATLEASYSGSGTTWSNLIAAPADSSTQTDWDARQGFDDTTTGKYPTFTGSAGSQSAYWSMDGNDYFVFKNAACPGFLVDAHKNNAQSWWFSTCFRSADAYEAGDHSGLFGNVGSSWDNGVRLFYYQTDDDFRFNRVSIDTNQQANSFTTSAMAVNTDYCVILSYDAVTQTAKIWVNSATVSDTIVYLDITGEYDATTKYALGGTRGSSIGSNAAEVNTRFYHFGFGNEYLDDTKAAAIKAHLETRHGRSYG